MPDARQVHADLVRAPGADPHLEQRERRRIGAARDTRSTPRGPPPAAPSCACDAPDRARSAARCARSRSSLRRAPAPGKSSRPAGRRTAPPAAGAPRRSWPPAARRWCSGPAGERCPAAARRPLPRASPKRCSSAFTSVPECTPAPAWTTMPAGLSMATRSASSYSTVSGIASARRMQRRRVGGLHFDGSPAAQRVGRARPLRRSRSTWPRLDPVLNARAAELRQARVQPVVEPLAGVRRIPRERCTLLAPGPAACSASCISRRRRWNRGNSRSPAPRRSKNCSRHQRQWNSRPLPAMRSNRLRNPPCIRSILSGCFSRDDAIRAAERAAAGRTQVIAEAARDKLLAFALMAFVDCHIAETLEKCPVDPPAVSHRTARTSFQRCYNAVCGIGQAARQ